MPHAVLCRMVVGIVVVAGVSDLRVRHNWAVILLSERVGRSNPEIGWERLWMWLRVAASRYYSPISLGG